MDFQRGGGKGRRMYRYSRGHGKINWKSRACQLIKESSTWEGLGRGGVRIFH